MPIIPALKRLRQESQKLKASLTSIARLCLKTTKTGAGGMAQVIALVSTRPWVQTRLEYHKRGKEVRKSDYL
jgi:hypothetical protein